MRSDALSRHEAHESELIRGHCLAHGRRPVSDLEDPFPVEGEGVIEALKQVFDHEEEARDQQLSPEARWASHQALSQPILDGLKQGLQKPVDDRLVDPNSSLGQAISYLQSHWVTRTRLGSIPNAPLDNHVVEGALNRFIGQRQNARFFRPPHRAYLASGITRLIATCLDAGVNALDDRVERQAHRREGGSGAGRVAALERCPEPGLALGDATLLLSHLGAVGIAIPRQNEAVASGSDASVQMGPLMGRVGDRHEARYGFS